MNEQEVKAQLAAMSEEDRLWRAIMQVLEWDEQQAKETVCHPEMTAEARAYNAGRLGKAIETPQVLRDIREQALQEAR